MASEIIFNLPEEDFDFVNELLEHGSRERNSVVFERAKFYSGIHRIELFVESDDLGICCAFYRFIMRDDDGTMYYSKEFYSELPRGKHELIGSDFVVSVQPV